MDVVVCFPPSVFSGSDVFEEGSRMLNLSRFENIQGSDMKGKREMQTELHTLFIYFLIFNFYLFYFVTLQYCIGFAIYQHEYAL